jgi:hypothetical protein
MRNAVVVEGLDLNEHVKKSLRELGEERAQIRLHLQSSGTTPSQWAELEHRACIAELVGRKATPNSLRTVDGAVAAMRAFRMRLAVH